MNCEPRKPPLALNGSCYECIWSQQQGTSLTQVSSVRAFPLEDADCCAGQAQVLFPLLGVLTVAQI